MWFIRRTKPIWYYFPDIAIAQDHIKNGIEKYRHSKKYILGDAHVRGCYDGKLYIDAALAAIMYATGKEPKRCDLNTPSESYGWAFDDTRDILNALNGLHYNNPFYWNILYGEERNVHIKINKNAKRGI